MASSLPIYPPDLEMMLTSKGAVNLPMIELQSADIPTVYSDYFANVSASYAFVKVVYNPAATALTSKIVFVIVFDVVDEYTTPWTLLAGEYLSNILGFPLADFEVYLNI